MAAMCIAVMAMALVPVSDFSDSSGAVAPGDIAIINEPSATVVSGKSIEVSFRLVNTLPYQEGLKNKILVTPIPESNEKIKVTAITKDLVLEGNEDGNIIIKVSTDRFMGTSIHPMKMSLECRSMDAPGAFPYIHEYQYYVAVESAVYSGDEFNMIMGIFDPLPAPLDKPIHTAIITFLLWIIIGICIAVVIAPLVIRILAHGQSDKVAPKRGFRRIIVSTILVYAFGSSLRVYGAPEEIIETVRSASIVLYVIIGGALAWKLYLIFTAFTMKRLQEDPSMDGKDIEPLILLIGKILIAVSGMAFIMASFGINMASIVTSAGLVTLGITYGASNVLSQFFSGITILMTHPFKEGDLVRIGGLSSTDYYKVKKVKVMVTVFDNWLNRDTIVVPNNVVVNSIIVNMTGRGRPYRVDIFSKVPYGTDLDKIRSMLLNLGGEYGRTVTDGSVPKPYVNIMDITNAGIDVRLTLHIKDVNELMDSYADLREKVYRRFADEGITIPYPHVNIVMGDAKESANQ